MSSSGVIRLPPHKYIHVLDSNANVTRVVNGPQTYTRQDHERVVAGPEDMITIPPRYYVVISDPVVRDDEGQPMVDKHGQIKLRHSDQEIRLSDKWPDPFPLYPGESKLGDVEELLVVEENCALRLRALRDFKTEAGETKNAGDEWLFAGPRTYIPRVEEEMVEVIHATVIKHDMAIKLRANRECTDSTGQKRKAGEEWLVRKAGAYLPAVDEEIVETVDAQVLTDTKALHLIALKTFTDSYGQKRKAGEEWLVTNEMSETHILDVNEQVGSAGMVDIITLTNRQYCVVLDPYVEGVQRLGTKELRRGELNFFLQPGESLANGIQEMHVLADDEALLLQATEATTTEENSKAGSSAEEDTTTVVSRRPGDRWMVYGPCEYIPPVAVEIRETRKAIPLDQNEGIYVRDTRSGKVRAVIGSTYMLQPQEELWAKSLPVEVEDLLSTQDGGVAAYVPAMTAHQSNKKHARLLAGTSSNPVMTKNSTGNHINDHGRDETRVVSFRVPHNAAMQVYDYKEKVSRIVFGPTLVMLGPDEQFTVIRLSGDKPKRPNVISTLCVQLGPDFMTDVVTVETSDHARLQLTLSFNWFFDVDKTSPDSAAKIFNVRDFVGDACKALASRVRGAVAGQTFDDFHKHSATIICQSVFGKDKEEGKKSVHTFNSNNLCVTNVDIQSVEPVDARTRESLQKSVQLAIEITTKSQEARAKHEAKREEEEAKGRLERQQIENQSNRETARKELLELQANSSSVEAQGAATADAKAKALANQIEGEAAVKQAELRAQAMRIESGARLEQLSQSQQAEVDHQRALDELEIFRQKEMAAIDAKKFKDIVTAIGPDTIAKIARAGPEMQAKLLGGLGLKGYLVTDGKNPINLFQTAKGMIGQQGDMMGGGPVVQTN